MVAGEHVLHRLLQTTRADHIPAARVGEGDEHGQVQLVEPSLEAGVDPVRLLGPDLLDRQLHCLLAADRQLIPQLRKAVGVAGFELGGEFDQRVILTRRWIARSMVHFRVTATTGDEEHERKGHDGRREQFVKGLHWCSGFDVLGFINIYIIICQGWCLFVVIFYKILNIYTLKFSKILSLKNPKNPYFTRVFEA